MKSDFQKKDLILGWVMFLVSAAVYLLTVEPTASWWDCGEYIATAYKLQVGHPPGAPLFQLIGRFFSLFAFGNTAKVALLINCMSAICSGFTIMFLYWTITLLGRKIVGHENSMSKGNVIAVLGSGVVGALAYTFSDSFWFSAVEGEVYAMSSFFTALVFWCILRWERVADEPGSMKWVLLIAYFVGLSIGVHLLNLLAIPAIAYVFYFKKYKHSLRGFLITGGVSLFILGGIQVGIIPWVVKLAAKFELFFVNGIGMPFNSGTIVYWLLVVGGLVGGLYFTQKQNKVLANFILLCFTFILIGYSSFVMIVIRANANTPINENAPTNAINLLSYLNREQYGTWPLSYGQYFNTPLDATNPYGDGEPIYVRDNAKGKYTITDNREGTEANYDSEFETLFPRMWSRQRAEYADAYKEWSQMKGRPLVAQMPDGSQQTVMKPTFRENMRFFFRYQVGHMYFRYFMWNFAGRQNNIEGHGGIENGNWISGISALDNFFLGNQDDLPMSKKNTAQNRFYLLPLILGFIGWFYHMYKHPNDSWIVFLLFIMTGLAIVIYLNQTPYQPRERDYAYAGSFYAFAIWIGLGVMGVTAVFNKLMDRFKASILATLVALIAVPCIMAAEGWDDHDRSGKTAARDWAVNYLNSCAPNAILFTNGDNDTFPLWYAQEVEGIRTDIRVVNYMLASGDWYVHQLGKKVYNADRLKFTLTPPQYKKGINEIVPFYDRGIKNYLELKEVVDFIASDNKATRAMLQSGREVNYLPSKKLKITVDKEKVLKNGIVPPEFADKIVDNIQWTVAQSVLLKNDLMLFDMLASNQWERPIYFVNPSTMNKVFNIEKYCHQEGFVYRFMPVLASHYQKGLAGINTWMSYDILMNKCEWGHLADNDVTVDRESYRECMVPRQTFIRTAEALVNEGQAQMAIALADRCQEIFPNHKISFNMLMLPLVEVYYQAGAMPKGTALAHEIVQLYTDEIMYCTALPGRFVPYYETDLGQAFSVLQRLLMAAKHYKQDDLSDEIEAFMEEQMKLMQ